MFSLLIALNVNTADACPMADAQAAAEQKAKVEALDGTKVTLKVDGMTCGSCSEKVTAALTAIDGVTAAAVDYQKGTALVAYEPGKVQPEAIAAAIVELGFKAEQPQS